MEKLAREMIEESPELMHEFDSLLKNDESFRSSRRERLSYFYERSPYWDEDINLYPVGRIMNADNLKLR